MHILRKSMQVMGIVLTNIPKLQPYVQLAGDLHVHAAVMWTPPVINMRTIIPMHRISH